MSPQQRGLVLEGIIGKLLSFEKLQRQSSYRPHGEQVDTAFCYGQRYFLLEAKWEKDPLPASAIFSFRGKLEGKLVGTIGVVVSISGFSDECVPAVQSGKQVNTVLFTKEDFEYALDGRYSFKEVLEVKLRRAAFYGDVYYSFKTHLRRVSVP